MMDQLFNFQADGEGHRIEIGEDGLQVSVDPAAKQLVIDLADGSTQVLNLSHSADPLRPAFMVTDTDGIRVEFGQVDFHGEPLEVFSYPLNETFETFGFTIQRKSGHIGILDIRDLAREAPVVSFHWDMVPILLWVVGNDLQVATVECLEEVPQKRWYIIHEGDA